MAHDTKAAVEETSTSTADELVYEYANLQLQEKQIETRKKALAKKLNMLIAADADTRTFRFPDKAGGRFVLRRVFQDRRKPGRAKLVSLLQSKHVPAEAFDLLPKESYVATMLEQGMISLDEFKETLEGNTIEFVTLTWKKDGEPDY